MIGWWDSGVPPPVVLSGIAERIVATLYSHTPVHLLLGILTAFAGGAETFQDHNALAGAGVIVVSVLVAARTPYGHV